MDKKRLVDGTTALAEKRPRVIKIEPAERPQNVRLRVAAYTRVSSDSEDQLNSFAAQNRYYTELISGKAEWRMVDIYADEGITGTSVAKRDDFQRMMADCRRGLIDQILVKSISRFARNTKDCLQNIRKLKELGVNVRFEREGIDTVNVSSELITAIYAAFAQKESESISGNMRWSYQRRMESGTFLPSSMAYGYRLDGNKIVIDPEAALISSGTAQAGRAWNLLRRPCRTAVDESGLRRIRSPDRHGPGQPPGYVPHLRRRLCRKDVPPDGPHRSSRQCGRPVVHRGLRGDLAGCAGWLPRTYERIHDRTR